MATPSRPITPGRILLWLLLSPLYAVYGLVVLVRGARGFVAGLTGARRALDTALHCPNGHANPTVGRFECARCGAVYHGWVGRCAICEAGAGWIVCEVCGVAIRLPWVRS